MLFHFRLSPLDQVTPWGGPETPTLHWFALTQGAYWIEAGGATIFEYSPEARRLAGDRYCDYYVSRFHEDLLAVAPHALEPVPADLQPYLFALSPAYDRPDAVPEFTKRLDALYGSDELEDERLWETIGLAIDWTGRRAFDSAYLTDGPTLALWSDASQARIAWNTDNCFVEGVPAWSARSGAFSLPTETFVGELRRFHERLMEEMGARIDAVLKGALSADIAVDREGLAREHEKRRREMETALAPSEPGAEWDAVRAAIRTIETMKL